MPVLRAALVMLVGLVVAAAPWRARAETPEAQVERLAAEAVNAYRGADYNRAVELLNRAYEIRQVPALLYNLAKAYDKLGDVAHAEDAYRRYVASLDADAKLKAKAEARLIALDEQRRKNAAAERAVEPAHAARVEAGAPAHAPPAGTRTTMAMTPPATATSARSGVTASVRANAIRATPPTLDETRQLRRRQREDARRRARQAALGLGITTLALGAVAIGLSVSALSLQHQWAGQYGGDEDARRALKNESLLRAGVSDGFYALTAVSAAVTAYFIYRGFHHEPADSAPSLALSVSPAGAYIGAQGHF